MGLDMYLKVDVYVGGWRHASDEDRANYATIMNVLGLPHSEDSPSLTVSANVAYWRKVNAVHGWFVTNVQNGVDECQPAPVTREQLILLRDTCADAVADHDPTIIEPKGGFFFGSTQVDEWYWRDLEDTITQLNGVLALELPPHTAFTYQSSW